MSLTDDLEGEEIPNLIKSDSDVIRVVSGPGSGKSTGLKRRVLRLIEEEGVSPDNIFVGTFTRAITSDLADELGDLGDADLNVSTIHSLALSLLNENKHVIGGRKLRFLLEFEIDCMLYDIKESLGLDYNIYEIRDRLELIQSSQANQSTIEQAELWGQIRQWMIDHGGMLVNEVVPICRNAIKNNDINGNIYNHVIVDEYQDLTRCEQEFIEDIWSGDGSLVVLGDDDQSIYGFRYNHPDGISGFSDRHEQAQDISPIDNWRSGSDIVGLANLMIAKTESEKDPMNSKRPIEGNTTLVNWESIEEEVNGLGRYIKNNEEKDFLVLVPRRFVGYRLQDEIGNDARTVFNQEVLEHTLVQKRFTLASVAAHPDDRVAFRAWLGFDHKGGSAARRNSPAYLDIFDPEVEPRETLKAIVEGNKTPSGKGQKNVRLQANALHGELSSLPDSLSGKLDYLFNPGLADAIEDSEKRSRAKDDLSRLHESSHSIAQEREDIGFGDIIDNLRYKIATRAPLTEEEEDARVRIMTLHSAKGLEADVVVIAGMADQMIPGLKIDQPEEREEQRRLLYVAVTRARDNLIVSWPRRATMKDAKSNFLRTDDGSVFKSEGSVQVRLSKTSFLPTAGYTPVSGDDWLQTELD